MSNNFAVADDNDNEFQDFIAEMKFEFAVPGKRGGGRSVTNNIGAEDLGYEILKEYRENHGVDVQGLFRDKTILNTLMGVIDQKSFKRAQDENDGIPADENYSQSGILAVSLAIAKDGVPFLQWWKGTLVNSVLTFTKIRKSGAKYILAPSRGGGKNYGFYKVDSNTGRLAIRNKMGDYFSFPAQELVNFEDYLNEVVTRFEVPVAFPTDEVSKLRGLSEILANVNLNSVVVESPVVTEDVLDDEDEFDEEEE